MHLLIGMHGTGVVLICLALAALTACAVALLWRDKP